jgi:prepilin-type N-terminal cleavage/methylation domain-containing protein
MRRKEGFTLLELMVTLLIVGVLSATAIPLYHTWTQRAYGTEAAVMMKQIMDGEIMYYLAHDEFFPQGAGEQWLINADGSIIPPTPGDVLAEIKDHLNVVIPIGHHLQYDITNTNGKEISVTIASKDNSFPIFKNGQTALTAVLDSEGNVVYF